MQAINIIHKNTEIFIIQSIKTGVFYKIKGNTLDIGNNIIIMDLSADDVCSTKAILNYDYFTIVSAPLSNYNHDRKLIPDLTPVPIRMILTKGYNFSFMGTVREDGYDFYTNEIKSVVVTEVPAKDNYQDDIEFFKCPLHMVKIACDESAIERVDGLEIDWDADEM